MFDWLTSLFLAESQTFFLNPTVSRVFQSPGFSGSRFFWVQVFQGPGPGAGSKVWVQVLEVALTTNIFYYDIVIFWKLYIFAAEKNTLKGFEKNA